jgi:preprotein translocase subunit SecF
MEFFKKKTTFRFMGQRRRWYTISAVMIVASRCSRPAA